MRAAASVARWSASTTAPAAPACWRVATAASWPGALAVAPPRRSRAEEALRVPALRRDRPVVCAACGRLRMKTLRAGVSRLREELAALLGTGRAGGGRPVGGRGGATAARCPGSDRHRGGVAPGAPGRGRGLPRHRSAPVGPAAVRHRGHPGPVRPGRPTGRRGPGQRGALGAYAGPDPGARPPAAAGGRAGRTDGGRREEVAIRAPRACPPSPRWPSCRVRSRPPMPCPCGGRPRPRRTTGSRRPSPSRCRRSATIGFSCAPTRTPPCATCWPVLPGRPGGAPSRGRPGVALSLGRHPGPRDRIGDRRARR